MLLSKTVQLAFIAALTPQALAQILDPHDPSGTLEARTIERSGHWVHGTPHKESSDDDLTPLLGPDHVSSDSTQPVERHHYHKARSVDGTTSHVKVARTVGPAGIPKIFHA
ncbi:hypothetical protein PspLS_11864 [Pyricularia sp. CBS 133598]|nr:hypothetical protein PspLS_11864 [Pyricularia sp. CBS 133598]